MTFRVGVPSPPIQLGGEPAGACTLGDIGGVGDPPPELPNPDNTVDRLGEYVSDGQAIESGDGEYEVICKVTKGGKMSIEIAGPNHSTTTTSIYSQGTAGIRVEGSISKSSGEGSGNVSVRTVKTGTMANQGNDSCTLTALRDKDGDPAIGAGSAAFIFDCYHALSSYSQLGPCSTTGTVIVENCLEE